MKKMRMGVLAAVLLTAFASAAQAEVKFGAIFPFSGELALLGDESWRGVELAVEERNAAGGVQGEKIVLARGDAVDNNQAIAETRRLISVDGVKLVFGAYSSARSQVASQVAELAQVPYFELGAVSDPITERGFKYLLRTNPTASNMAMQGIEVMRSGIAPALGVDPKTLRIGIIHEDSLYGTTVAKYEQAEAAKAGLQIVSVQPYPASTADMSSLILRLQSDNVDVVMQTSYQNDTVLFFRQANEAGYQPKAVIGNGGGYSLQQTMQAVGADIIDNALNIDVTQYSINPRSAPGLDAFLAAYRKKYGSEPRSGHSLLNYVGAKVILDAINGAKGFEPDTIMQAVRKIDIPEGGTAEGWGVHFNAAGQNERAHMMVMQWQGGKLVTVFPKAAAVSDLRLNK
jgi:branched-chain amino acid transport system substrate-binding protein